jgi:hypothetical protein
MYIHQYNWIVYQHLRISRFDDIRQRTTNPSVDDNITNNAIHLIESVAVMMSSK